MDFRPINADHAVQSASCSVVFDAPIPAAQLQALRARKDLLAELPAVQAPQGVEFQMAPGQLVPTTQKLAGIQLSHLRPDGTPAWALRLMGTDLSVDCNRYTRWDRVWKTAQRYLEAGLDVAAKRKVVAVAFVVVDAFIANREDYRLKSLLQPSPLLADRIFHAGPTWHNHLGWFNERPTFSPPSHWLNQLNVDAVRTADDLRVQITHNQQLLFDAQGDIPGAAELELWFSEFHLNNKRVLLDLLERTVSQQIGLELK